MRTVKGFSVRNVHMGGLFGGDSPVDDLPKDATLLIEGPPMTGKYELLMRLIAHHADDAIIISTMYDANRVVTDIEALKDCGDGRLGVIDCVPRPGGVDEPSLPLVRVTGSPENLTRIGVGFTDLFEQIYDESSPSRAAVGIHSISQLLMHAGLQNTYQFLQVITGQVRTVDWMFVAVIDTTVNEEDRQTIYHHFDGVIQTRENSEGGRELRVRGLAPTASGWVPF